MLQSPDTGFRRSVEKHNSDLDAVCDWIEASVLFADKKLSRSDIVDLFLDDEIYVDSDFAGEMVDLAFGVIAQRLGWTGRSSPIAVDGDALVRQLSWTQVPGHAFCLLVSLRAQYGAVSKALGVNYGPQGDLFERLTSEALARLGWDVHRVGWSSLATKQDFEEAVESVADKLNEKSQGGTVAAQVKDAGLDLLCVKRFRDKFGGHPFFLVQCGSGANWQTKLRSPGLNEWGDLIRFTIPPMRALAIPFAFAEEETFRNLRLRAEGMLLDRYRILSAGARSIAWTSGPLRSDLVKWLKPAVAALPLLG